MMTRRQFFVKSLVTTAGLSICGMAHSPTLSASNTQDKVIIAI